MRRALRFSALLLGILVTSSQMNARTSGGGGLGVGFSGGFRGASGAFIRVGAPAHLMNGFHRNSVVGRHVFVARHPHALGVNGRHSFAQTGVLIGGGYWSDWWPGDSQIVENSPAPEAPAPPEVIVIHPNEQGSAVAGAAPDYGYAGCHAIPNGYHCDGGG